MNPMRNIIVDKVVVNIGVGKAGEPLEGAKSLLERITDAKVVETQSKTRNPTWGLRKGLNIGVKATLRGEEALEFLKKAFKAVDLKLKITSFDGRGNFAFGVKEYIDFPGVKYDPGIGMYGFDVAVSLRRPGYRVAKRKVAKSKVGKKHVITNEEAVEFVKSNFNVEVI